MYLIHSAIAVLNDTFIVETDHNDKHMINHAVLFAIIAIHSSSGFNYDFMLESDYFPIWRQTDMSQRATKHGQRKPLVKKFMKLFCATQY